MADEADCWVVLALLQIAFLVMTKDLVQGVGRSPVCQILRQIVVRVVIASSPLAGPVLLGCCQLQLTSLSSIIVLQPNLLCKGWGGHPLSVGPIQY